MEREYNRASSSINWPPLFDGEDYSQWKIMMGAFLYSQDENMWNIVENGWEHPTKAEDSKKVEGSSARVLKPRKEWTEEEVRDRTCDFKARNSLFTALSKKERMRISHCDTAKQAWDLLQVTYEGNKKVRGQKLQRLVLEFENMTMGEDESIDDFHARLLNVTNQCRSLDDPFEEHRIVKKFLRALPSKFQAKQIAIEETQDLDTYSLDELIGNLKTFEMRIKPEKKVKNIAFSSVKKKDYIVDDSVDLALLTKEFKIFFKNKSFGNSSKILPNKPKCFECGGIGHLAADCGNKRYNLRGNKALKSTWSDSDEGSQSENEEVNLALTSSLNIDFSDGSDLEDDTLDEETNEKCKQLYNASKIVLRKNKKLEEKIESLREEKEKIELQFETSVKEWNVERTNLVDKIKVLQDEVKSEVGDKEHGDVVNKIKVLQVEVKAQSTLNVSLTLENEKLQDELFKVKESFNKFSIGSEKVSKMIGFGKTHGNKEGLGFEGESCKPLTFVKGVEGENPLRQSHASEDIDSGPKLPKRPECKLDLQTYKKVAQVSPDKLCQPRVTQNQRKTMGINSHASLQAELKEGLNLIARIAKLASIPVNLEPKMKQKQIWIKKGSNNRFSTHMDNLDNMFEHAFVPTDHKLANLFTRPLDIPQFESLRSTVGGCSKY
ncbi:uncharacterized protein LOC133727482 [Rosa rugosa]|uniref:uncharacterized protein LOC133727482 n=1 Tax=Rosa rugosa TaxID=74645 RepID=UPI002B405D1E|nr:uncharacterized protein LOC133727482 [Rosa rugosa]